ncbi:MAG: aminotransferase class I/II-fold pyridoxal phosphate-dependent enzyme [Nitrospinae bacterium]|nr:aminotransferase class I/II-fold pyridoxal phosphate-dependent enzyme [Nitrospinota bacterium]
MKRRLDDLALFGGPPLFDAPRPIGQLAAGSPETFFTYAKRMYDAKRLTNNGPLVQELEERLAHLHQVTQCIAFCSASVALIAALKILAQGKRGEVIMPAFTYAGLPHLARWAGLSPRFCDIDAVTHTLDPERVAEALGPETVAVLGVHQVNSPCFIDALDAITRDKGVPLFFDSVHAVGATYRGRPLGGFGRAEIFSLHATKLINGFEGGYVTTNDEGLAYQLRLVRNFGFTGSDTITTLGVNGKLNEVHAALALSSLEGLDAVIAGNRRRYERYREQFAPLKGYPLFPYPEGEKVNFEFALLEIGADAPLSRDRLVRLLRAENALARPYYSPPLHRSEHMPEGLPVPSLPVTEAASLRYIQMPVGERVSEEDIQQLAELTAFALDHGPAITARMGT